MQRAYRLALGVEIAGHLDPLVDDARLWAGFCSHSAELAALLRTAIERENVGAAVAAAHPDGTARSACDVLLPCSPHATDEEIDHAVLAAVKAAHLYFCARPD
jgi:hypothetical protein